VDNWRVGQYPHLRKSRLETGGQLRCTLEHVNLPWRGDRTIIFSGHSQRRSPRRRGAVGSGRPDYRAANNPLVDQMITRFRGPGEELIPKGTVAARRAIAALRRGAHLTMLADQKMNDGIPVPFFGRSAMTAPALAVLALRFDCDVVPARVERLAGARWLTICPPLPLPRSGDHHADVATLMAQVNRTLEAWIRDRPEQWFWLHRRWPD
jgi:KDO2-lipid IV(A) lauroyltransferase